MSDLPLQQIIEQLERIANSLNNAFPPPPVYSIKDDVIAYLWEHRFYNGIEQPTLIPVEEPNLIAFEDLQNIDRQKAVIEQNTRQFVEGLPANNVLLTGARGTGKSSLIKACLNAFHQQGLRLIEVDKEHLMDLPQIISMTRGRSERFIIFCDDISFEEGETGYKGLKTVLDGSIAGKSDNTLIYATSNRKHLMPERIDDNLSYRTDHNGEIHPGEVIEEKVSLSERFGLWISIYGFNQEQYLTAVSQWLTAYGIDMAGNEEIEKEAIRWATYRGSRSGRIAAQFAKDYAGRLKSTQ